jgi:hypothetical protein
MVEVLDASFTLLILVSLRVFQQSEAANHEDLVPRDLAARVGASSRNGQNCKLADVLHGIPRLA